jgi:hypothetical protein
MDRTTRHSADSEPSHGDQLRSGDDPDVSAFFKWPRSLIQQLERRCNELGITKKAAVLRALAGAGYEVPPHALVDRRGGTPRSEQPGRPKSDGTTSNSLEPVDTTRQSTELL